MLQFFSNLLGKALIVSDQNPLPITLAGGGSPMLVAATANSTGNSTITPGGSQEINVVTLTGTASTRKIILDVAGRDEGDVLLLRFVTPATAAIVIEVRDAAAGGTLLYSYTTDGSGTDFLFCWLYFDGTAWQPLFNVQPVV